MSISAETPYMGIGKLNIGYISGNIHKGWLSIILSVFPYWYRYEEATQHRY